MIRSAPVIIAALLLSACGDDKGAPGAEPEEQYSGGAATVFDATRMAFGQDLPLLTGDSADEFFLGNAIFNRGWVTAPASVKQFDGLGPFFNATNCSACHLKDGRGRPPEMPGEQMLSMLVRISVPGMDAHGGPMPEPTYGGQIQDRGVLKVMPEAQVTIQYEEVPGSFADGEPFSLRKPTYTVEQLAYGPMAGDVMLSPRVAQAVFGLGLLAAVPDSTLEGFADPDDQDGDGISGRINHVWNVRASMPTVGRFGWKANQPSLEQQSAGAFNGDMGISSSMFHGQECTPAETLCLEQPTGEEDGQPEVSDSALSSVVHYMHTLAVPARRDWQKPEVLHGKQIFNDLGCAGCHVSMMKTGPLAGFPELENHTIRPYTDLLLHDMGEGLADHRPDFEATGSEWRTSPLWGIGLVKVVNHHEYFLHDGRARGLMEAVLWHGGEAQAARDEVLKLSKEERAALLAFLGSL
ncbi:MAG: di-heme oxidoredictase family protein [Myxococcales bacterium]